MASEATRQLGRSLRERLAAAWAGRAQPAEPVPRAERAERERDQLRAAGPGPTFRFHLVAGGIAFGEHISDACPHVVELRFIAPVTDSDAAEPVYALIRLPEAPHGQ